MRKSIVLSLLSLLVLPVLVFAHKPLLMVDDNGDGTIYIETGFSDGSSGSGHTILIKELATGKLLEKIKIPEESAVDANKPSVPYLVIFDAGDGHVVETEGPAPSGQEEEVVAEEAEETEEEAVEPPQQTIVQTQAMAPAVAAPVAYQSVPQSQGFAAAYRMMLGSQMFISVGIFLIFGALMFIIGSRWERKRQSRV